MTTKTKAPATKAPATKAPSKVQQAAIAHAFELGFAGSRADSATLANDCAMLKAYAVKGRVPDHIAKAYKAGVIAERLDLAQDAQTLALCMGLMERNAKRTDLQSAAILAANNRYSRRLSAAGLKGADDRGTGTKPPKADAPKADAPKADAPKADAPKADAPKADAPKVPHLVNLTDWQGLSAAYIATLKTAQRKNAKSATAKVRAYIAAIEKAHSDFMAG
jgi:hypothetical protein